MAYEIVLETFSGPLDLLLHLIQKHEVNIHDIPIATITDQYLGYLRAMEQLSLDIASEFIVMAATLIAIKSRTLLPRPAIADGGEELEDPREELVRQLLEYQMYKWAAGELHDREAAQSHVFAREPLDLRPFAPTDPPPLEGVSMWDLVDAFRKLLIRVPQEPRIAEIRGVVISVEDTMAQILARLQRARSSTFLELLEAAATRPEAVSLFLALLELVKLGSVRCIQMLPFGDIDIELAKESAS